MAEITPVELSRSDAGIIIQWSDGSRRQYTVGNLRKQCPCATCREKHGPKKSAGGNALALLPVLSAAEARPLRIERMRPVGNYAYNIAFSDGHDSGIYTFDFLQSLGQASDAE